MRYIIATLGCKVNQYETQAVETILQQHGHENASPADVVIVNTCAVTAEAGRKSRQTINKLRAENPGALIAVCGCYSQSEKDIDADIIFGTNDKLKFVEAVENGVRERNVDNPFERRLFEELPSGALGDRTRAMLKIQDGCVNFCSYCIIPYTRGRLRSLPVESAVKTVKNMDYREIVLTGIEIASYGLDLPGKPGLADIVAAVAENTDARIRLGSLEPTVIDREFCEKLSKYGNICRHFHLALQSGCDRTLKAMNRKYDTERFYESCELLREYFPGCALTCDMITGFPGETEEDFAETLSFIRKCGFSAMHIFPYSRRPGTVADTMKNQNTNAVKNRRAKEAGLVAKEMQHEYLDSQIGKVLEVLAEEGNKGHSGNYCLVKVNGALRNNLINVKIEGREGDTLYGTCI